MSEWVVTTIHVFISHAHTHTLSHQKLHYITLHYIPFHGTDTTNYLKATQCHYKYISLSTCLPACLPAFLCLGRRLLLANTVSFNKVCACVWRVAGGGVVSGSALLCCHISPAIVLHHHHHHHPAVSYCLSVCIAS